MEENIAVLGSEDFPIVLQPHYQADINHRYHWPRSLVKGLEVKQDYTAIEKSSDILLTFTTNLLKNHLLNTLEIRLATYFYQKNNNDDDGVLYLINSKYTKNNLQKVIGEYGHLYCSKQSDVLVLLSDVIELMTDLRAYNIFEDLDNVMCAMNRLVDFGYISVTEVSWRNVLKRSSRNVLNRKVDESDKSKVYAHHIRIHSMMDRKEIYKTFKNSNA